MIVKIRSTEGPNLFIPIPIWLFCNRLTAGIAAKSLAQNGTNLTPEQITAGGLDKYYIGHGNGVYPAAASGEPFSAMAISSKGDPLSDLNEDLAAEQKARVTYDNILRLSDDPDVNDVIKFLRQREVVHFQRFGEAMNILLGK